jgi:hypothetical protein
MRGGTDAGAHREEAVGVVGLDEEEAEASHEPMNVGVEEKTTTARFVASSRSSFCSWPPA